MKRNRVAVLTDSHPVFHLLHDEAVKNVFCRVFMVGCMYLVHGILAMNGRTSVLSAWAAMSVSVIW